MPAEQLSWVSAHYREPYHTRRTAKLPDKLRRLGVLQVSRRASVLDTCCGRGEALNVLREGGFERLSGIDALSHPEWNELDGCSFAHGDVRSLPYGNETFDAIMNLHALHHLGGRAGVGLFLQECSRVLRPGGQLFIVDFPGTVQIRLLFWLMRRRIGLVTGGLQNFAEILDEEWSYVPRHVQQWPEVQMTLRSGPLRVESWKRGLFLYYARLVKPM